MTESTDAAVTTEFNDRESCAAYFLLSIEQALYAKASIKRVHGAGWWSARVVPELCDKLKSAEKHHAEMRLLLPSYPAVSRDYAEVLVRHMWARIKALRPLVYGV